MTLSSSAPPADPGAHPRVLGRYDSGRPGPTVVCIGALHGNEPAGLSAISRVLARLRATDVPLRGQLLGVSGNRRALAQGRRFVDRDLNRQWTAENIARIAQGQLATAEDQETRELLGVFLPLLRRGPVSFIDLHSTSSLSPPFSCMADVLRNRPLALALPIPVVLGLDEVIEGSMLGYLCDLGHVGVAVEGGQHDDPRTIDFHESALLLMLVAAGSLEPRHVPDLAAHRARLGAASGGMPAVCEIRHRHVIQPEDEPFVMKPGFVNFQVVERGQVIADDRRGPLRVPETGLVMLPRYQGQGDDGFFIARPVTRNVLRLSAALRTLRLDVLVPYLPGVSRDPQRPDHYIADPAVARVAVKQVFHLFGYRQERAHAERLVFSRRRPVARPVLPAELAPLLREDEEG
ncbi:succinylglutamate desuccinylase/aspartoacylase domain-containing protein [Nannocystis bainbridge]|uniref:Succinylglutamate desuccinylase/aspartoacylase family protein n=1 Tax=Nannocystis bainbridge TaxID=2995303 RepID=A0ABT5EBJ3_9BACT|nr:succinylglutamate desuccinylase/aspartoacylase family protein [Nannocystis bainbridge]MDC0723239.1 succinylglutamate desuccinylase/aspartoacylase family protein [Nannocystis bainbridge]